MVKELSDGVTETQIVANTLKEMVTADNNLCLMVSERYCNYSPKPEFFLFSLFVFSFISQLMMSPFALKFSQMKSPYRY